MKEYKKTWLVLLNKFIKEQKFKKQKYISKKERKINWMIENIMKGQKKKLYNIKKNHIFAFNDEI